MKWDGLKRFVLRTTKGTALALALCLFGTGFSALAGSPLFYDGEITWAIGRRNSWNSNDFNYSVSKEQLPRFGSIGEISPELCGIPSNRTNTTFTKCPAFISIQSQELRDRGGYIYIGYVLGYSTDISTSFQSVSYLQANVKAYLSQSGSLSYAVSRGTPLTISQYNNNGNGNTGYSVSAFDSFDDSGLYFLGLNRYDGSNFPHTASMLAYNQTLEDKGYAYSTLYGYGDTSMFWNKLGMYRYRIEVPAFAGSQSNTIWIDLGDAITGTFKSVTSTAPVMDSDGNVVTNADMFRTNCIYLCPVYCYAVGLDNYEAIEYYLNSINDNVQALSGLASSPSPEQVAWLNQYSAQVAQIKAEAASAAVAAQYTFDKPNTSNLDVAQFIDPTAKQGIMYVVGKILSHTKIIAIITICMMCGLIGYIFYGKKE